MLVFFAIAVGTCYAQTYAAAAHVLMGSVHDPSDAAIVAAEVDLILLNGRIVSQTKTDSYGNFRFSGISSGAYRLEAQHEGFRLTTVNVRVGDRPQVTANIVLPIAVAQQEVTVASSEAVPLVSSDVAQNQNANTIERSALDQIPVFDQDYIATLSRFLDNSSLGTNGVSLVVNGVEANGPGVTNSAVKSVKINQNPYSALYSRPGRGRIEIETKGGSPQYHGEVNVMLRDAIFDAKNAFATVRPSERRQYYEGSVTGPLGRGKKTTFLASVDEDRDNQQAFVVAQGLSGPIQTNVPTPSQHFFASGRIFHDIGATDQFWIGYSYEQSSRKNQNVGGIVLPEAGTNLFNVEHEVNVSYRKVFSPRLLNQFHFLVGHQDSPVTSTMAAASIVVQGAFIGGGAQGDSKRTEAHTEGTDIVTYDRGKHDLKFGVEIPDWSRRGADDFTNYLGTYSFASLADYEAGRPANYLVQRGQGHLVFLEKNVAGFIEDNVRVTPRLQLSLGLRYYFQNYFHDDSTNFAPRLGFAWAPGKKSKTVIRGGGGMFFDRTGPRPIADLLHFNGTSLQRFIVENPTFPVDPNLLIAQPTSLVVLDPQARIPYTIQYGLGVERQINSQSTLSVNWIGTRGIDLFRSIDANAPPPPLYATRPDLALGQVRQMQSEGYQKSNAMEVSFRGRPTRFFTGQVQYTLSKTYNNTSGITYFPGNSYFPENDWARADTDSRHRLNLMGTFSLSHYAKLGTAFSAYSGTPVTVTTGSDNNHDGISNDRPAGLPRNTMHGPGFVDLDLSLSHEFLLSRGKKEGRSFTAQLGAFNVLNHRNDVTYVGILTSPFFGRAVAARSPRQMQANLQFKF
ncbi:MAG TPA: TonB-dependent receptor [Terriglobales bacterium]|nr:TonB-dependent receptor [Terriglobales bacterium]